MLAERLTAIAPARPHPLLLRRQRLERDRGRAQDELPLLAQSRPPAQAPLRHAQRTATTARRWARSRSATWSSTSEIYQPLLMDVLTVPSPDCYMREAGESWEAHSRRMLRARWTRSWPGTRTRSRGHRRAAGAVRRRHAHVSPGLPRAAARGLRPVRRAPDRGRDRGRLRPHRARCSPASRPASRPISSAFRRA